MRRNRALLYYCWGPSYGGTLRADLTSTSASPTPLNHPLSDRRLPSHLFALLPLFTMTPRALVQKAPELQTQSPQIWIERDGSHSRLADSGHSDPEPRIPSMVPDALTQGGTAIVTIGDLRSNQMRHLVAVARKLEPENIPISFPSLTSSLVF